MAAGLKKRFDSVIEIRAHTPAFAAGCDTQSAANGVVVEYDLSSYAKNALKKYVPQLCGNSYDANELHDDHPVRVTNEGLPHDATV